MDREHRIKEILMKIFNPIFIELENESANHSVPKNSETHFKLILVTDQFEGKSRLDRQRSVNESLKDEFKNGLHALTQRLYTPQEWAYSQTEKTFSSPACLKSVRK